MKEISSKVGSYSFYDAFGSVFSWNCPGSPARCCGSPFFLSSSRPTPFFGSPANFKARLSFFFSLAQRGYSNLSATLAFFSPDLPPFFLPRKDETVGLAFFRQYFFFAEVTNPPS